ncbi:zinc finger BED domain-containing protein RICESLEEPER 2-like isoform X2 [Neltuma alba]|uniref:zinc finger BED domain-containing protein RICESLEEPER 2-like isoform X2 n=1 Tax=Neltuma alba TaxID=207710 RepID=UPI0010A42AA5|nr:zinc finger BED domain-containing protein RICESLEEPER 2-like isoform X2 [Prosopis alba]
MKDMHKCIESIWNAIKCVRSSPIRFCKFKELVEQMKIDSKSLLSMDCSTRWNSTYMMLENAIKFSSGFERMEQEDEDYINSFLEEKLIGPPSTVDWKDAKDFVSFLEVFYSSTLQFSGSLSVTSNVCFQHMVDVLDNLNESANDHNSLMGNMAKRMQSKFNEYWGKLEDLNPLLLIAVVLDPRFKMKYLEFAFKDMCLDAAQRGALSSKVLDVLYRLYDHYSSCLDASQIQSHSQTQVTSESSRLTLFGYVTPMERFLAEIETKNHTNKYAEVEKYLKIELAEAHDPNFDILAWWKLNAARYKVLSLIARDVLAMPISTVSSESAFSMGGRVIDEFKRSLSPKMVEALICVKNWLSPLTSKLKGFDINNFNDTENVVDEELEAYVSDEE